MARIKSGAGTDLWTIDSVSKAGRVSLYDALGNILNTQPVSGTFFQSTQPVSGSFFQTLQPTIEAPASLAVTATGAAGAAVTATLPAISSQFHYITLFQIIRYAIAAITGTATPVIVTTTNLPGSLAFTFDTAGAIGTSLNQIFMPGAPLKSSVVNTATTIVCPATTSVIWRINAFYYGNT